MAGNPPKVATKPKAPAKAPSKYDEIPIKDTSPRDSRWLLDMRDEMNYVQHDPSITNRAAWRRGPLGFEPPVGGGIVTFDQRGYEFDANGNLIRAWTEQLTLGVRDPVMYDNTPNMQPGEDFGHLLGVDFGHIDAQLGRYGGGPQAAHVNRDTGQGLTPYWYNAEREALRVALELKDAGRPLRVETHARGHVANRWESSRIAVFSGNNMVYDSGWIDNPAVTPPVSAPASVSNSQGVPQSNATTVPVVTPESPAAAVKATEPKNLESSAAKPEAKSAPPKVSTPKTTPAGAANKGLAPKGSSSVFAKAAEQERLVRETEMKLRTNPPQPTAEDLRQLKQAIARGDVQPVADVGDNPSQKQGVADPIRRPQPTPLEMQKLKEAVARGDIQPVESEVGKAEPPRGVRLRVGGPPGSAPSSKASGASAGAASELKPVPVYGEELGNIAPPAKVTPTPAPAQRSPVLKAAPFRRTPGRVFLQNNPEQRALLARPVRNPWAKKTQGLGRAREDAKQGAAAAIGGGLRQVSENLNEYGISLRIDEDIQARDKEIRDYQLSHQDQGVLIVMTFGESKIADLPRAYQGISLQFGGKTEEEAIQRCRDTPKFRASEGRNVAQNDEFRWIAPGTHVPSSKSKAINGRYRCERDPNRMIEMRLNDQGTLQMMAWNPQTKVAYGVSHEGWRADDNLDITLRVTFRTPDGRTIGSQFLFVDQDTLIETIDGESTNAVPITWEKTEL